MMTPSRNPFPLVATDPVKPVEVCVADSVVIVSQTLYNLWKDLWPKATLQRFLSHTERDLVVLLYKNVDKC